MFSRKELTLRVLACLMIAAPAAAQVTTAELVGTATDPSGGVVATAKVTLSNPDTGFSREASTDSAGAYIMTLLPPGAYSLTAEAAGFRRLVQSGIVLQDRKSTRLNSSHRL